jgi:hypothetical protein
MEQWNTHTSCFIEHDQIIALFQEVSTRADTLCSETDYGDQTVIWIQDGKKLLNFIGYDPDFTAESLLKSLQEANEEVNASDLGFLIHNMQSLHLDWRSSINDAGELRFYVDAI